MPLFGKKITAPAYNSAPLGAAAGASQIGQFYSYTVGAFEEAALSVPTIARAVSLLSTVVGTVGEGGLSYTFKDEDDSVTFTVNPASGAIDEEPTFDPDIINDPNAEDNYLYEHEDDLRTALRVVDSSVGGRRRRRRRGARKTHRKIKRTTKQTRRR
jgi:hypothetical protein